MASPLSAEELRLKGNESFKSMNFQEACSLYSQALKDKHLSSEQRSVLLTNRAACWIKLEKFAECEEDCAEALRLSSTSVKAMYRMAVAQDKLGRFEECIKTLKVLLQIEPTNRDALELMRSARALLLKKDAGESTITKVLRSIQWEQPGTVTTAMQAFIECCKEDVSQSLDFIRKGGFDCILQVLERFDSDIDADPVVYATRLLAILTNHKLLVERHIDLAGQNPDKKLITHTKINAVHLCQFLQQSAMHDQVVRSLSLALMNILKHTPASADLDSPQVESSAEVVIDLNYPPALISAALNAIYAVLVAERADSYAFVSDLLSALISDLPQFTEVEKPVDARAESLTERKQRFHRQRINAERSKAFVEAAHSIGFMELLARHVSSDKFFVRSQAVTCLGKLIKYLNDDDRAKAALAPFLDHPSEFAELAESKSSLEQPGSAPSTLPPQWASLVPPSRHRAALEAALFVTHPELGAWALNLEGGLAQLMLLISTQDPACLEIAAEVLCLAAGVQSANDLLASLLQGNVLHSLLSSTLPGVRAAAASVLTKLSLKAKALSAESEEVAHILNAVAGVFKTTQKVSSAAAAQQGLVSFSHYDNIAMDRKDPSSSSSSSVAVTAGTGQPSSPASTSLIASVSSLERSLEVLAAMVGQTFVKEEVVHGSARVASLISDLAALEVDGRSTAAYGLAHIYSMLTVTNRELKALALKDKEISLEQYEQMQELQRIKTKDAEGVAIEEKQDAPDEDTADLCKQRIRKIVAKDGIKALLRLAENGSTKTKETACRALRQICVDEMSRGLFVQQGGLKLCCSIASAVDNENAIRFEAAHAVAKALVTTNPNVLSEHLRLASFRPLVYLCREVDSSNLQQFEALLSLTNLLSCGAAEQDKFVAEKGVHAVHYLMFSNNLMVRRAASEALCNMALHEGVLALLRKGEQLKLWLALTEDWTPNPEECAHTDPADHREAFLTARACTGTLAMAANDEEVARTMVTQDVCRSICSLLATENPELVHRALVLVQALLSIQENDIAMHLLQGGVVPAMAVVAKTGDHQLGDLARECASMLSAALAVMPTSTAQPASA